MLANSVWRLGLSIALIVAVASLPELTPRLPSSPNSPPIVVPLPDIAGDAWDSRGRLISHEPYDPPTDEGGDVLGEAWRAVYLSVSGIDGTAREVSGAFFVPQGDPPEGGWPVISFAHGTTGVGNDCGPSRQPNFQGYLPVVGQLLANGFAVAFSDYEGLGHSGTHPYLEPNTAAFNIVDAVRAMRNVSPAVSSRWIAFGYSQGGQASWAANELNPFYGQELQLLGSIALAPAANVSGIADMAWKGSLTEDQRNLYPLLITGLARYTPGFDSSAFLHGTLSKPADSFTRCGPAPAQPKDPVSFPVVRKQVVGALSAGNERRPDTSADVEELRTALRRIAVPQRPLSEPMLVVAGERDPLVLAEWVVSSVADSCALGGQIEFVQLPNTDHRSVLWEARPAMLRWMTNRFDGVSAPSNCPPQQPR